MSERTYAEQFIDWLVDEGYTHCFFLAGGNIMHFLNAARTRLTCIPVVNEVAAGIAVEYFNALRDREDCRAFALVTAGPGVTNAMTALAGAYLESRELLLIAGQVKSSDLATPGLRQRGIQEVDGIALTSPVCKGTLRITQPVPRSHILNLVMLGRTDRKGPVFIEFCLDAQAAEGSSALEDCGTADGELERGTVAEDDLAMATSLVENASRPVILLGGGIDRSRMRDLMPPLESLGIPIMTTWNALDRVDWYHPLYRGRPDTWGMRASNLIIQQADLLVAVGARLSLQQTGFNWREFLPVGQVIHVDVDDAELAKLHPEKALRIQADAALFLENLSQRVRPGDWVEWREFSRDLFAAISLDDPGNVTGRGFISPYQFSILLSEQLTDRCVIVPCSSGGASTVLMQSFMQKAGQKVMNDKALASMGYGLSGAIGAAFANPDACTILVEGDGGFAQNLQELGTVATNSLNLKIFLFCNDGYASIRMTQRNYFGGAYVGCDGETGVGLPDWSQLASAYSIRSFVLRPHSVAEDLATILSYPGPALVEVPIDPEQTYFPKISSRVRPDGGMESNPIHRMSPDLTKVDEDRWTRYLRGHG